MSSATAIVTGATGWLGTRLIECLTRGLPDGPTLTTAGPHRRIRAVLEPGASRASLSPLASFIDFFEADLADADALTPVFRGVAGGTVFHCAGVAHPLRTASYYRVNVEGTRALLAAARLADIRRFVHVSADSVLGTNATPEEPFDELSPYQPTHHYARSKMLAERAVWESACSGGAQAVIVRPATLYGPHHPPRRSRFFRLIRQGRMPLFGGGDNRRSLAYVDNVCQALMLAEGIERARGQTYWIADERPYAMRDIYQIIRTVLARDFALKAPPPPNAPRLFATGARLTLRALEGLGFHSHALSVMAELDRNITCRIRKAVDELGYAPKVDLAEGMRRSIRWMLENGETL